MSSLINFSMKNANGGYTNYTMSVNDKQDDYGNNASVFVSQTKEERDSKTPKKFVGNGKVAWTDGNIVKAEFVERKAASVPIQNTIEDQDLPFNLEL